MKAGDKISRVELELSGYEILCKFGCGYIWKKKDGTGRKIMWDPHTEKITLIYGDEERYATTV